MKRKIGTVVEETLLSEAKQRAAREGRALADVIQGALSAYLHDKGDSADAMRACEKFCAHGSALERSDIDELLQADVAL